jgi:hypothetical protein
MLKPSDFQMLMRMTLGIAQAVLLSHCFGAKPISDRR